MNGILEEIFACADTGYRDFQKKLIPTVDEKSILGVRAPHAQKIAKKYAGTEEGNVFLDTLPHKYYDENVVHAFMLGALNCGEEELENRLVRFLPFIDNWAVCDGLASHLKSFFKDKKKRFGFVLSCIDLSVYGNIPTCFLSPNSTTYTIRFGLVCLLSYYVEEGYLDRIFDTCVEVSGLCGESPKKGEYSYYVSMAVAWLVSACLIKEYHRTLTLIKDGRLGKWIHNKSIQKACESHSVDGQRKVYLKSLKK